MATRRTSPAHRRLAIGDDVLSADAVMLGTVAHLGHDAFVVAKGFAFLTDASLPLATIAGFEGAGAVLTLTRDEAKRHATRYVADDATAIDTPPLTPVRRAPRTRTAARQTLNVITAPVTAGRDEQTFTAAGGDDRMLTRAEVHPGEHLTVPVIEERLEAEVREVEGGHVRIIKEAMDTEATLQVPVTHDEVYVRRRAVSRPATPADLAMRDRVVDIPLHAQQVVTRKEAMVTGEVDVRKEVTRETEWVTDTVRRETVRVEDDHHEHVHIERERGQAMIVEPAPEGEDADAFVLENTRVGLRGTR